MARAAMTNINKVKKTLLLLSKSKPGAAKKILKNANRDLIKAISEIALNMLNGVVPLTLDKKKQMHRHKNSMRLITRRLNLGAKRKIVQRGGFIGSLLGIGLPLLIKGVSSLISHIKRKKSIQKARKH